MTSQSPIQFSDDGQWWWDGAAWRAVQSDPPPAAVATPSPQPWNAVDPAVIAVARPQRFVALNPGARHKYNAPADGGVLERDDVAVITIMVPLLSLWDEGVVDYTHTVTKKLMMTFNAVKAVVKQDVERPGITGQLLSHLKVNQDVDGAVRKWLGKQHPNPWNHVIGTAVEGGVGTGLYTRVDANRNPIAAAFKGSYTLQVDGDRLRAADPEADRLAAAFKRHREANPEVHDQLWKKIHGTISGNTERDRTDNDF